jgi:hypothetical protein
MLISTRLFPYFSSQQKPEFHAFWKNEGFLRSTK